MLRAIAAAKKKNDRIDASKICDCLRCDFLPECYMASTAIRERRRTLRYRNLLVRQMVQMKNKISTLLMEAGVSYNKQRLHKAGYFRELLATNPDINEGLRSLLRLCRETVVRLQKTESAMVRSLERDSLLMDRVERLMTIPAVGPITALTWALEVGDVQRFSSIKKAISYCGLCGAEKSSGNTVQRTPLSKQRNKHLQTTLIEAAKMAPRNSPDAGACSMTRKSRKAMPIAPRWRWHRKLVAYLMAVDRGQRNFQVVGDELHRRVERGDEQGGFLRRVACQVLPLTRLGEGAQALDAPVDKFRDWQEITNSIFCSRPLAGLRQQMEVWFYLKIGTTAERPTHAAKNQKEFTPALLRSASGELLPS